MTDIPTVDTGCKSVRCRQAGICNCLHVYDDGTAVSGAGTAANPYVHAIAPIRCIIDTNGTQLTPNAARCITLPSSATAVQLSDGTLLSPNINGIVVVPETYISEFKISDSDGTVLTVADNATINFDIDGGATQSYVAADINYPTIVGSSVIFPREKGLFVEQGDIFSSGSATQVTGTVNPVTMVSPTTIGTLQKNTNLRISAGIGLADLSASPLAPAAGESINYTVIARAANTPFSVNYDLSIGRGIWTPDNFRGFSHVTYVADFDTGVFGLDKDLPATISIILIRTSDNLQGSRVLHGEAQLAVQWL